jgi:hypothetical protein
LGTSMKSVYTFRFSLKSDDSNKHFLEPYIRVCAHLELNFLNTCMIKHFFSKMKIKHNTNVMHRLLLPVSVPVSGMLQGRELVCLAS